MIEPIAVYSESSYETTPDPKPEAPEAEVAPAPPPEVPGPEAIDIYVCPACGSWYGSSNAGNLQSIPNVRSALRNLHTEPSENWGSVTGTRAECQVCLGGSGNHVTRKLVRFIRQDVVVEALRRGVEEAYQVEEQSAKVRLRRPDEPPLGTPAD